MDRSRSSSISLNGAPLNGDLCEATCAATALTCDSIALTPAAFDVATAAWGPVFRPDFGCALPEQTPDETPKHGVRIRTAVVCVPAEGGPDAGDIDDAATVNEDPGSESVEAMDATEAPEIHSVASLEVLAALFSPATCAALHTSASTAAATMTMEFRVPSKLS